MNNPGQGRDQYRLFIPEVINTESSRPALIFFSQQTCRTTAHKKYRIRKQRKTTATPSNKTPLFQHIPFRFLPAYPERDPPIPAPRTDY